MPAISATGRSTFCTPSRLSCDTYYYTLAERLGIEKIAYWAHKVGIGQKTGIDLPGEVSGTMPSEEWKMKTFHEKWYAGEVISVGIGQGAVAVSPVQLVRAIAGIASGGVLKRPHVVEPDQLPADYRQAIYDSYPGSGDVTIPISPAIWETITEGMAGSRPSRAVRRRRLIWTNIDFAGKTGTAQVVNHSAGMKSLGTGAERANAWFVGIAPRRNPDIAVVVLVEHGGWGARRLRLWLRGSSKPSWISSAGSTTTCRKPRCLPRWKWARCGRRSRRSAPAKVTTAAVKDPARHAGRTLHGSGAMNG